ncbi:hypothetical protein GF314_02020 [bacterium]|nr:hypothetical protein [bacterium]
MPASPARRRTPAAIAIVLVNLAAVLAASRWRLAPAEWPVAWPGPGAGLHAAPGFWVVVAVAAVTALAAWWRADRARRPALLVVLLWPAVAVALAWIVVPTHGAPDRPTLVAMVAVLLAVVWLWRRRAGRTPASARRWHEGRAWRAGHAAVITAGVTAGILTGGFTDARAIAISVVFYPFYGLVQLGLLLALTWPDLQRATGDGRRAAVVTAAAVFALVHWPNPLVMALTGAGMLFWAREYARGRPLWALALSMGLLATLAAQGLPDEVTHHMRVGPGEVRARSIPRLAREAGRATGEVATPEGAVAMLARLYPDVVGRAPASGELDRWRALITHERRCFLAWEFLTSDEARRRRDQAPPAMSGELHWTELSAPWPARIRDHARAGRDLAWPAYVATCYRDLLGREPTAAELAMWPIDLGVHQGERLVRALLEHRGELADAPLDTLASEDLEFWR